MRCVSTCFVLDLCLQQLHQGDPLSELDPLDLLELELLLTLRVRFAGQHVERSIGRGVGLNILHQRRVATQVARQDAAGLQAVVLWPC